MPLLDYVLLDLLGLTVLAAIAAVAFEVGRRSVRLGHVESAMPAAEQQTQRPRYVAETSQPNVACTVNQPPQEILFGDPSAPDLKLTRLPRGLEARLSALPDDDSLFQRLAPFVQAAPSLAVETIAAVSPNLYSLTFSPQMVSALASGQAELARAATGGFRAFAVGPGGIVEHGVLRPLDGVQVAAAGMAIWQILSIVTATYHLQRINTRLAEINDGISDVRRLLLDARRTSIEGKYRYLADKLAHLIATPWERNEASAVHLQLEAIDRELIETLLAIEADLNHHVEVRISTVKLDQLVGTDKDTEILKSLIEHAEGLLEERHLALLTRAATVQMLACLPGQHASVLHRIGQLRRDNEEHLAPRVRDALLATIDQKIVSKVWRESAQSNRSMLTAKVRALYDGSKVRHEHLRDELDRLHGTVERQSAENATQGLKLAVEVDEAGRLTKVFQLAS